jgi:glycosyltransferase involved in cell wall biosynthesis
MDDQILFQEAIYQHKNEYFSDLYRFVSKFDNSKENEPYKRFLKNPTVIIPNGVPLETQYIKEKPNSLFNIDNPFKFVVCGRITESKHIHIILEAFEQVYEKYPFVSIDFYGSVENYNITYYEQLCIRFKQMIDNKVISFKGNIDDPKVIMKNYHSIIVLGTHQGSPNVVLEAVSCKLPCIANDSGGTKEIIQENTGILLPPIPQVEPLIQAMIYSILNYDLVWTKNENAFNLVKSSFSMEAMKNKYMKVIYD